MQTLDILVLKSILEVAMDQELPSIAPETHFYDDLGMDSMGAVAMVVEIQRRLGVRIPDEEVPSLQTAESLIRSVNSRLSTVPFNHAARVAMSDP